MPNIFETTGEQALIDARQARADYVGALVKRAFAFVVAPFKAWQARSAMAAELYGMSERELADIGLSRGDIASVVAGTYQDETRVRGTRRSAKIRVLPVKAEATTDRRLAA